MLTPEDVARLAHQARFSLSPDELEQIRSQLSSVLEQMSVLEDISEAETETETAGAPSEYSSPTVRLRADDSSVDELHLPLEKLSPDLTAGFFTVPRVLGEDSRS